MLVRIDEAACIGCTKCLDACPVDAIIGASKQVHTVLTAECIGCQLCLPPCPTRCIHPDPQPLLNPAQRQQRAQLAKTRVRARKEREQRLATQKAIADKQYSQQDKKALIAEAIARAQRKQTHE